MSDQHTEQPRTGRPVSDVWALFDIVTERQAKVKHHPDVRCKACGLLRKNAQVQRLISHVIICEYTPMPIKALWTTDKVKRRKDHNTSEILGGIFTPRKSRRTSLATPNDKTKLEPDQNQFALDLANVVHSMGLPFRAVESEHFRLFIQRYIPQFELPTRERIGGDLLGKVYLLEKKSVIEHLQAQRYLSVVTDGWTDPSNNYVVNFMVVTQSMRPMFWSSIRTEDAVHDAATISKKLLEVIDDIERACSNRKVCSVVTDNASVMTKAWQELQILKPWIICNGCAAHASNLMIGKLFDCKYASGIFYDILSKAKALTKFVKKRTALSFQFREQQKVSIPRGQPRRALSLPVSTRWYSSENCIRNVVRNQDVLHAMFSDEDFVSRFKHGHAKDKLSEVMEILADPIFWHQAKHVLSYTEPITNALAILERDKSFGSMVYEQFKCMLTHPVYGSQEERNDVQTDIIDVIRSRWRSFHTPVMLVSFLLDPTKRLHEFLPDDKCIAIDAAPRVAEKAGYTGNRLKNFKKELENFVAKKDQWPIEVLNRNRTKSPTLWWISTDYTDLSLFAQRLFCIPTSSASSERSWSIHGFIHSKNRNRLDPSKVEMLAFIYANQGNKDPVDPSFYEKREYLNNPTKPTQPEDGDSDDEIPVRWCVNEEVDHHNDGGLDIEPLRKRRNPALRSLRFETEPARNSGDIPSHETQVPLPAHHAGLWM